MADEAAPTTDAPDAAADAQTPEVNVTVDAQQADNLGDAGKAALTEERKARRDAEKQLKAAQAQLKAFEDANKTEAQKAADAAAQAQQAADTYRTRYEGMVVRTAVTDAAVAAKAIDPATVYALVKDDITLDDNGDAVGVDKAVAALVTSKPFLFNTTPGGARDVNAGRGSYALNDGDSLSKALLGAVNARS